MKHPRKILIVIAPLFTLNFASAADLTVQIDDVKSSEGQLTAAVSNSADTLLKMPLTGVRTPAITEGKTVVIKDLPSGECAI